MGSPLLFFCFALISCACTESTQFQLGFGNGRIVGGEDVNIMEVPYQVSIQLYGRHCCGGTIVASNIIVTAAHCLNFEPSAYTVRVGSSYVDRYGEVYSVEDFVKHPGFTFETMESDVAVIWLSNKMKFSGKVRAIKMKNSDEKIPVGDLMMVTGWGAIKEGEGMHSLLQKVYVPKVSDRVCKMVYRDRITSTMICAGYLEGGKDACQNDSGGPLVHNSKLVGIVSWGNGCGRLWFPGVYAKVSALRSWIDTTIEHLQLKHA